MKIQEIQLGGTVRLPFHADWWTDRHLDSIDPVEVAQHFAITPAEAKRLVGLLKRTDALFGRHTFSDVRRLVTVVKAQRPTASSTGRSYIVHWRNDER